MNKSFLLKMTLAVGVVQTTTPALATVFSDSAFDLDSYSISKFMQSGTVDVSQTLNGGNPGAALFVDTKVPAPGFDNSFGRVFLFNKSFTYNPQTDGAIDTVSWSIDKYVQIISPPNSGLFNATGMVILQGGKIYDTTVVLPSTQGVFLTAGGQALRSSSFNLVTDPTTGATDASSHPDFASGLMQFGTRIAFGVAAGSGDYESLVKMDNFSVTVATSVPEANSALMALIGIGLLSVAVRKRDA